MAIGKQQPLIPDHRDLKNRFQVSVHPPAKKTVGLIEEEAEFSCDLHGIRLKAPAVVTLGCDYGSAGRRMHATRTKSVLCNPVWDFTKMTLDSWFQGVSPKVTITALMTASTAASMLIFPVLMVRS